MPVTSSVPGKILQVFNKALFIHVIIVCVILHEKYTD